MKRKPQGRCLQKKAQILFPDGEVRTGSVWQHKVGVWGIYAAVPVDGKLLFFALNTALWSVVADEYDQPSFQGMGPSSLSGKIENVLFRLLPGGVKGKRS